jgi:hypothetical protein
MTDGNAMRTDQFRHSLLVGLTVHVLAIVVFLTTVTTMSGSCSQDAVVGLGLATAIAVDLLLIAAFAMVRRRRLSIRGLSLSFALAIVALGFAVAQLASLPGGCPV